MNANWRGNSTAGKICRGEWATCRLTLSFVVPWIGDHTETSESIMRLFAAERLVRPRSDWSLWLGDSRH
ncbi:hypothetical protein RRSWK_04379 [Rhodopirellula sp. SWK7]|nr:hypothetical protein RRSWK_04379 [Rhodopirellula sp. SWK7]